MRPTIVTLLLLFVPSATSAQTIVDSDFSKGDFAKLGWTVNGAWDVYKYPEAANNPGYVARFAANKPDGSLTKRFAPIKNPSKLTLSLAYGWGWGDEIGRAHV